MAKYLLSRTQTVLSKLWNEKQKAVVGKYLQAKGLDVKHRRSGNTSCFYGILALRASYFFAPLIARENMDNNEQSWNLVTLISTLFYNIQSIFYRHNHLKFNQVNYWLELHLSIK